MVLVVVTLLFLPPRLGVAVEHAVLVLSDDLVRRGVVLGILLLVVVLLLSKSVDLARRGVALGMTELLPSFDLA